MKILIAEDDPFTRGGLNELFTNEGWEVRESSNGTQALKILESWSPDLVCLDVMMPGHSGYEVVREMRKQGNPIPVIFISAKSEEIDRVVGLELGADDYILKPFGTREVLARIKAILRRSVQKDNPPSQSLDIEFDLGDLTIVGPELRWSRGELSGELSTRELNILQAFHRYRGKVLSRAKLFELAWNMEEPPLSRTLDQHIAQLRKKIETDPKNPKIIVTVPGVGYKTP